MKTLSLNVYSLLKENYFESLHFTLRICSVFSDLSLISEHIPCYTPQGFGVAKRNILVYFTYENQLIYYSIVMHFNLQIGNHKLSEPLQPADNKLCCHAAPKWFNLGLTEKK